MLQTTYSKFKILQLWVSDLDSERGEFFLVDGSLIDGVGDRQVDHFTDRRNKADSVKLSQSQRPVSGPVLG